MTAAAHKTIIILLLLPRQDGVDGSDRHGHRDTPIDATLMIRRPAKIGNVMDDSEIYAFIESHGTPYTLPGPWRHVNCHTGFFRLPEDPSSLFAALRATFSDELLIESRAIVSSGNGELALNPQLAGPNSIVFALRDAADGKPFDLWADGVSIRRRIWPVAAVLRDYRTAALLAQSDNRLYIAFSMADLAVMWTLGFPAALSTGLESFTKRAINNFCELFGIPRHSTDTPQDHGTQSSQPANEKQPSRPKLTLVGWSLANLDPVQPPQLRPIQEHFQQMYKHLGILFTGVNIWRVTGENAEHIKFCLCCGDSQDFSQAFFSSITDHSQALVALTPAAIARPQSYAEAVQTWETINKQTFNVQKRNQAWDKLMDALDHELIAPLMRLAAESTDLIRTARILALADISRLLHPQGALLAAKRDQSIRQNGTHETPPIPKEEYQLFLTLSDRVRALSVERPSWRRKNKK